MVKVGNHKESNDSGSLKIQFMILLVLAEERSHLFSECVSR